jgi:hypothetical protein
MSQPAVEAAVSVLANTMRIYVEAQMRFMALFKVDREEAINNVDRAFEAKLEALHTLYDVTKADLPWFDFGDTLLLIAMRNAVHHRNHPLFRSLYARLWLEGDAPRRGSASVLLAGHTFKGDAPLTMEQYFRLDDFRLRLDADALSPYLDTFLKGDRAGRRYRLVADDLSLKEIYDKGAQQGFQTDAIYLDVMPIYVSGVCRVFKALKNCGVEFKGFDASVYLEPFTSEIEVDLKTVKYQTALFPAS